MKSRSSLTYQSAGVDSEQQDRAMPRLTHWIEESFKIRDRNQVQLPLGYFANVIDLGGGKGLALSTDGVGTKCIVAQLLRRYDTVGHDCVAMNVNDVLCVGAEPVALLDYVAVERADPEILEALARGLYEGAKIAGVTIPGGEIAQVREMIRGPVEGQAFDLVGSCVGLVDLDKVLTGAATQPGDVIIGLRSSGVHSNGLTLARRVLFDQEGWKPERHVPELGRTVGEELLQPTRIYVREVLAMLRAGLAVKALAHITSTGFLNLTRADATVAYVLDQLPEPQPVFSLIQSRGMITDEEMYYTYNMGIGFCAVVASRDAGAALDICRKHQVEAQAIGHIDSAGEREVRLPRQRLVGQDGRFVKAG